MRRRAILILAMALAAWVGADAPNAAGQSDQHFVLTGVMFVEGRSGRAWLLEPILTDNQEIALSQGESIGPYRLTKVVADRVELEGPAGTVSVPLARAAASPGVVTPKPEQQL